MTYLQALRGMLCSLVLSVVKVGVKKLSLKFKSLAAAMIDPETISS